MKFTVYNQDERFGDEEPEYFDTLEEAEARRGEIMEEIFQAWIAEAYREAEDELSDQVRNAIQIAEEEEEEEDEE